MSFSAWMRKIHRWLSVAFTVGFIVNATVIWGLGQKSPPFWMYLLALIPLFLLLPTGVYLFALPYAARWGRRAREVGAT
ncbi:hypothetical protein [Phenylobacterium montanum]|uniref:Uncharacterized protein n=1 Tax=Phenylobacterium montanum TaxID=2823693 RepID=A0A975FYH2_9CAUL|nr:hypothetical protein [Caulobacter sp. S6]QUD87162.1 hypothetical protein KCG34_19185 [Caulobacter sp. S6]